MLVLPLALAFAAAADTARVVPNENRAAAGRLRSGVLTVRLEAREGVWYPEGEHGPGLPIAVFAEEGKAPSAPGPLIRVPAGTEVRVTVRNTLAETLWVFGLQDRPAQRADSVEVLPGTASEIAFRATTPGTWPQRDAPPLLNGSAAPPPLELAAGRTYRLRLINIAPSSPKQVRLRADTTVQEWRAFAKDGAYLPAWQRTVRPAVQGLGPGETYDFEFTPPQPRDYVLEVRTFVRGLPTNVMRVPVRVR